MPSVKTILNMKQLQSKKKNVQKLTGRIAALNRFISRLAKCSLSFFIVLRGSTAFDWGDKQQEAFKE